MEIRMRAKKALGSFTLDIDFSLAGDDIGIFGQSGSGKSTLVGLLAGLSDPDEGEIGAGIIAEDATGEAAPVKRRHLGPLCTLHDMTVG